MGYANFYSFNLTNSNQNKGGRSASQEVEYLEEGDEKKKEKTLEFKGDRIRRIGDDYEPITNTNGAILYKGMNGDAIAEINGDICLSTNATVETAQIALALASKKFNTNLEANGSIVFKSKLTIAAVEINYPIHFANQDMENQRIKLQEERENERNRIARKGSGQITGTAEYYQSHAPRITNEPPPERKNRLHHLSSIGMVQYAERTEFLLQSNASDFVDIQQADTNYVMRRDVSSTRREIIDKTANDILIKNKSRTATDEIEYIEGKSRRREDLVYFQTGNMPKWALEEAEANKTTTHYEFFKASELYEAPGNVTYYEVKFALPNDLITENESKTLSTEQQDKLLLERQINVVKEFMKETKIDEKSYALAIHNKDAQLDIISNKKNPHVHLMFSTRILDKHDRSKEQHFGWGKDKRYSKKNPDKSPCQKDDTYAKYNDNTNYMRELVEKIIDKEYKELGIDKFVCSGNKQKIKEKCLERGDLCAAEIAATVEAQNHTGEKAASKPNHPRTIDTMKKKEQAQAIRDKYKSQEIEHQELGTPKKDNQKIPDNLQDLQAELAKIENRMSEIRELFLRDTKDAVFPSDKSSDINAIQAEIILTEKRIQKNPRDRAIKNFFKDNKLEKESINYVCERNKLKSKENLVAGIEKQITSRFFKTDEAGSILAQNLAKSSNFNPEEHCSPAQKFLLQKTKLEITQLKKSTSHFHEKHIRQNKDKIDEYEKKVIARNQGNLNKIEKLKARIIELENQQQQPAQDRKEKTQTIPTPSPRTDHNKIRENIENLLNEYDKHDKSAQNSLTAIRKLNLELSFNKSLQKEIIDTPQKRTFLAISNLAGTPAHEIESAANDRDNLQKKYNQLITETKELEVLYHKKPNKFLMKIANDETKNYWSNVESKLNTTQININSAKKELDGAETAYHKILSKIPANSEYERAQSIKNEEQAIPQKLQKQEQEINKSFITQAEKAKTYTANATKVKTKLLEEINRPDKLQIVKNDAKQFTAAEAKLILNCEIFKLKEIKSTLKVTKDIQEINARITSLTTTRDKIIEPQIQRDAKTKGNVSYRVTPPSIGGSGSGGGGSSKLSDQNAASILAAALSRDSKVYPLVARIVEEDGEKDLGMMTEEQIQDYLAQKARDRMD